MAKKKINKPAEKKNPVGRPIIWTEEAALKLADELNCWMRESEFNFYYERFLYEVKGLYPQLISELSVKYSKFSEAIELFKKIKEAKIMDLGLKMGLSAALVKFYMINNSNWKDRIDTDNKTDITSAGERININLNLGKDSDEQ